MLPSAGNRIKTKPSGGLRPALNRLHGKTTNIDHTRLPVSSSTQNDEEPLKHLSVFSNGVFRRACEAIHCFNASSMRVCQTTHPEVLDTGEGLLLKPVTPSQKMPLAAGLVAIQI